MDDFIEALTAAAQRGVDVKTAGLARLDGRHRIGDSHPAGRALSVPEVLTKSSNVATATTPATPQPPTNGARPGPRADAKPSL